MMIELHFYGRLRDVAGTAQLAIARREGDDIAALIERIGDGRLVTELRHGAIRTVCDGTIVPRDHLLGGAREILFFPPVSGG